jgi:signal transduction histidine kinase
LLEQVADPDGMLARGDYLHRHPDEAISADIRLRDGRVFEHYSAPIIGMDGTRYGRVGYYQDVTQRERAANQIAAQEAQLRAQVAALQESRALITQADERQRREIAELLHGRVQTRLVIVEYQLDQALALVQSEPLAAAALLRRALADVEDLRERDVRQASHLLHPTVISVGLVPALATLADRFRDSLSLSVALSPMDADRIAALPEPVALGAYRVVEEALVNALRHGNARGAEVSLGLGPDGPLFVAIHDDGHGFDTAAAVAGMGFHVIGARVEQFGGEWTVESSMGEGTTVRARFRV